MAPIRPTLPRTMSSCTSSRAFSTTRPAHADLIKRPHRPYTFTQLLTLSDGSTFTHRTTSPLPVYKSTKDVRNTPLWNPSNARMASIEEDEAGRLRAFRKRFGRGFDAQAERNEEKVEVGGSVKDAEKTAQEPSEPGAPNKAAAQRGQDQTSSWSDDGEDNLMDLISSYGAQGKQVSAPVDTPKAGAKGKGKKR